MIIECRECKKEVSDEAPKCPHCGVFTPSKVKFDTQVYVQEEIEREAKIEGWIETAWKLGLGALVLWFLFSGKAGEFFADFKQEVLVACTVENVRLEHDIFITNGEADAGVRATALLLKENSDGDVTVSITVSSSEGDITKSRTVSMREGQRGNVVLQFPELTINATNITGRGSCSTI